MIFFRKYHLLTRESDVLADISTYMWIWFASISFKRKSGVKTDIQIFMGIWFACWNTILQTKVTSKQIFQHTRASDLQAAISPYMWTWRRNRCSNIDMNLICKLQYYLTIEHDVQTDIPTYTWTWFARCNITLHANMTSKRIFQHTREPDLQAEIPPYMRTWRRNRYFTYLWIWFPFRNTTVTHESDVHSNITTSMWTCSVRRYTRNRHLNRYMWIWCAPSSLRLIITLIECGYHEYKLCFTDFQRHFKLFGFQSVDYERTWKWLFRKRVVCTILDIFVPLHADILQYLRKRDVIRYFKIHVNLLCKQ